jgi:hypothetical protein
LVIFCSVDTGAEVAAKEGATGRTVIDMVDNNARTKPIFLMVKPQFLVLRAGERHERPVSIRWRGGPCQWEAGTQGHPQAAIYAGKA